MKKVIFSIIVFFMVAICFVGKVSAKDTVCRYKAEGDNYGYGYDLAKLTIHNAKKRDATLEFSNLNIPRLESSFMGFGIQKIKIESNYDSPIYNDKARNPVYKGKFNKKACYIDSNINRKKEKVPVKDIAEGECPEYVMILINDCGKLGYATFGNAETLNFLKDRANENTDYNYLIYGGRFTLYGSDTDDGDSSSTSKEDDEKLDTCEGLLGTKVDKEYTEGTVGWLLQKIFDYMKMAAVILVFAFSLIDYAKAIAAQDSEVFKKANINFIKRIIFGIIFFLIPEVINIILSVIDASSCGIH